MLPEHVQALKELKMEDDKINKPILDPQQLEELNQVLFEAIEEHHFLTFSYYTNGEIRRFKGKVYFLDEIKKEIHIMDTESPLQILKLENIIHIEE